MPLAIRKVYPYVITNVRLNLLLLSYILMVTVKNYTTFHLQLN